MGRTFAALPPPAAPSHEDINNAKCAILYMIDTASDFIKHNKVRDQVLKHLIEESDLRYGTKWSKRPCYQAWQLRTYISQLLTQLKQDVPETKPKNDVIWHSGSSVLKPEYLAKIGFEAYHANRKAGGDGGIASDGRQVKDTDQDHESVKDESIEPDATPEEEIARPTECSRLEKNEHCVKGFAEELFATPDGFWCASCVEYACDKLSGIKLLGGCNNPNLNVQCLGTKFKEHELLEGHVLCQPCASQHFELKKTRQQKLDEEIVKSSEKACTATANVPKKRSSASPVTTELTTNTTATEYEPIPAAQNLPDIAPPAVDLGQAEPVIAINIGQDESRSITKLILKRPADSIVDLAEPKPKRARPTRDDLHQYNDTGIAAETVQIEMHNISTTLQELVTFFHNDAGIDLSAPAVLLPHNELVGLLQSAYETLFGKDRRRLNHMLYDEILSSNNVLLGLLGAMLFSIRAFTMPLAIPACNWTSYTSEALRHQLMLDDEEMNTFQRSIGWREMRHKSFTEDYILPLAAELTQNIIDALMPHLKHMMNHKQRSSVRVSAWITSFEESLTSAVKRALLLNARFRVDPGTHKIVWCNSGVPFDRTLMKELNEAPREWSGPISMTLLPGWIRPASAEEEIEVVTKLKVSLDSRK